MPGVTAEYSLSITAALFGSNDLGTPKLQISPISELIQFEQGTNTVGKADLMFSDTRTLAASATEDLDLSGVLTDAFGAVITGAELLLIYVKAAAANVNNVQLTRSAANGVPIFMAAGDGYAIKPGKHFDIIDRDGITITPATGDKITLTNSGAGNSVTYNILIIARTVAA